MGVDGLACLRQEYDANLYERLLEDQLSVGGLYTAIFAIRCSKLAFKFPVNIARLSSSKVETVGFVGLDMDLKPTTRVILANMSDGVITNDYKFEPLGKVEQGYFMGYEAPELDELFDLRADMNILRPV